MSYFKQTYTPYIKTYSTDFNKIFLLVSRTVPSALAIRLSNVYVGAPHRVLRCFDVLQNS